MDSHPEQVEIDHHTLKLIVGLIAIFLPFLADLFSQSGLTSVSGAYHEGGWSRNIFVGFLFAISAFLLAYNGYSTREMVLSKIAAVAAMGVAMFPCKCCDHTEIIPYVHGISASVMFVILSVFCYFFFRRAWAKGHAQAKVRAYIYALCGITIIISVATIALGDWLYGTICSETSRLTFLCETAALVAFGIAWLFASRILPVITSKGERISLSPFPPNLGDSWPQ